MPGLTLETFDELPDVTPEWGRKRMLIDGREVDVPVMIRPGAALHYRDDDGMFMDPRDGSTWMVGRLDGVRVRQRASRQEIEP